MRSAGRSKKPPEFGIKDFYGLNPGALWGAFKQEGLAVWALCFYLAFEYVRPDIIYPALGFLPWAKLALILALIGAFNDKTVGWVKSGSTPLLLLFFFIVMLSGIYSFMPAESLKYLNIPINWILLYFLVITIINSEKRFFFFLLVFFIANFKMSQFGFRSFISRGFTFTFWGVSGSPGWFENGGDLALQMTIFVPLAMVFVYYLRQYWTPLKKWVLYLLPITGLTTLVAASSRGALLAFACICGWYLLKTRLGFKAIAGILVLGFALYQILPQEMIDKFKHSGEDATSMSRLALWDKGIQEAFDHPMLGVGYENWFEYCWAHNQQGIGRGQWCLDLHNTYVEAAAEVGLIGFSLFVILNLGVFFINAKTRKHALKANNRFIFYMSHGMDAAMIGFIVAGTFVSVLFYPMFWLHLAMAIALCNIAQRLPVANEEAEQPAKRMPRGNTAHAMTRRTHKQRN